MFPSRHQVAAIPGILVMGIFSDLLLNNLNIEFKYNYS